MYQERMTVIVIMVRACAFGIAICWNWKGDTAKRRVGNPVQQTLGKVKQAKRHQTLEVSSSRPAFSTAIHLIPMVIFAFIAGVEICWGSLAAGSQQFAQFGAPSVWDKRHQEPSPSVPIRDCSHTYEVDNVPIIIKVLGCATFLYKA